MTQGLPLPPVKEGSERPRIDYIVFLADAASRASYTHLLAGVQGVSAEYLAGHACVVFNKCAAADTAVTKKEIDEIGDLGIPVQYSVLGSDRALRILRDQIAQGVKIACGHTAGGVSPAVVEALNLELCLHTALVPSTMD